MTIAHSPLLQDSILARQIATETDAVHQGVLRYRRLVDDAVKRGQGAQLKAVERLIGHWHQTVQVAIGDDIDRWNAGEYRDGSHLAVPVMKHLGTEELSYIALNGMLGIILEGSGRCRLQSLCLGIGNAVLGEINLRMLKKRRNRDVWKELTQQVRKLCPANVNWWARKSLEDAHVSRKVSLQIGATLCRIAIDVCSAAPWTEKFEPSFRQWNQREIGTTKMHRMIALSDRAREIIDAGHRSRELLRPRYLPMLVAPYPWTDKGRGGYVQIATPFINNPLREQKLALEAADLARIRDGLTAVSSCPWRINAGILEIAEELWKRGGGFPSMPVADKRPLPPAIDWQHATDEEKRAWKDEASKVHRRNTLEQGHRSDFLSRLSVARRFADDERIYFPHQFDFRSRAYPIPVWLNHQGDDLSRGLLQFADARPVEDEEASNRLYIHAANCFGFDKAPFASRIDWVRTNLARIEAVADRPMDETWWHEADKPWQFLAACMAIVDPVAASRLPRQADGTCNGLQHYAAMTRDARGGRLVNLVDSGAPQDVYAEVACTVNDRNERNITNGETRGLLLQGRINRALVKRVVMTSVYGVTEHGAAGHLAEELEALFPDLDNKTRFNTAIHMAKIAMSSLGDVCNGATRAMAWIREHASRICHGNRQITLRWDTPLGFPVVQPYRRWKTSKVKTMVGEMKILDIDDGQHPSMVNRQVNGSAPNFVHGIDASHMLQTAIRCAQEGIAFAAVHDSYWTHAATADQLDAILREEFVKLHAKPLLEDLARQWEKRYGIQCEPPPNLGTLDIADVASSRYFFS